MNNVSSLAHIKLFKGLSEHELSLLEPSITRQRKHAGDYLFKSGDAAIGCYVIIAGEIGVYLGDATQSDSEPVAVLEQGETLGHMAIVDRSRRSASCRVMSSTVELGELRSDDFERLFNAKTPFAYKILDNLVTDLVGRLRASNQTVLRASADRKHQMDNSTKKVVAHQLLGKAEDWNLDKVEVLGMSLEHRIKRRN
jgi:CRP-like cAMP-binding protein